MIYLFIGAVIGIAICAAFCAVTSLLTLREKQELRDLELFYKALSAAANHEHQMTTEQLLRR